jgi:hypothetical protein
VTELGEAQHTQNCGMGTVNGVTVERPVNHTDETRTLLRAYFRVQRFIYWRCPSLLGLGNGVKVVKLAVRRPSWWSSEVFPPPRLGRARAICHDL